MNRQGLWGIFKGVGETTTSHFCCCLAYLLFISFKCMKWITQGDHCSLSDSAASSIPFSVQRDRFIKSISRDTPRLTPTCMCKHTHIHAYLQIHMLTNGKLCKMYQSDNQTYRNIQQLKYWRWLSLLIDAPVVSLHHYTTLPSSQVITFTRFSESLTSNL